MPLKFTKKPLKTAQVCQNFKKLPLICLELMLLLLGLSPSSKHVISFVMNSKQFRMLVSQAIDGLPRKFREAMQNIEMIVEDWPTSEELDFFEKREGIKKGERELLLGLYQGTPLKGREFQTYHFALPDRITLFQGSIEEFCNGDKHKIEEQIRITLLHEIGHYFGIEDDKLERLGY